MYAVQEKNMAIVKALLAAGADVTLKDLKGGAAIEICLLSAGRKSNVQIIKLSWKPEVILMLRITPKPRP